MECVQLTEPGRITVICQTRVTFDMDIQPLCLFEGLTINVPCKFEIPVMGEGTSAHMILFSFTDNDINHTIIVPSQLPLISDSTLWPTVELSFHVERYDLTGGRVRQTLQIQLGKLASPGTTTY